MQKNSHSELWKMKHLLKFTLHYDCGSEEKSTSVLFRFCEFPEGRNIQRYLQCAVNEKNPIAPYYSINTVTKNKAKGFFVKQETRHLTSMKFENLAGKYEKPLSYVRKIIHQTYKQTIQFTEKHYNTLKIYSVFARSYMISTNKDLLTTDFLKTQLHV